MSFILFQCTYINDFQIKQETLYILSRLENGFISTLLPRFNSTGLWFPYWIFYQTIKCPHTSWVHTSGWPLYLKHEIQVHSSTGLPLIWNFRNPAFLYQIDTVSSFLSMKYIWFYSFSTENLLRFQPTTTQVMICNH